jgi:hypothetical protein
MRRPDVRRPGEVAAALTAGPLRMRLFVSRPLTGHPGTRRAYLLLRRLYHSAQTALCQPLDPQAGFSPIWNGRTSRVSGYTRRR